MKPSPQQSAFVEACRAPGSIVLGSCAGSGKTTTLQLGAAVIKGTGRATSFSKPTVTELAKKMPAAFPARTMHGDGFTALKAHWQGDNVQLDKSGSKVYEFVKDAVDEADESWQLIKPITELVDQAQTAGIVPEHHRFLTPDTEAHWELLADTFDLPFSPTIHRIARSALLHSIRTAFDKKIITFNEMLYIPLFFPIRMKQHKTIIVDEAQDLSPIQHALLRKQLAHNGRIIAAGDKHQAIYGFRGAMTDSYGALIEAFDAAELALTVSYRCPQAVVREAQKYVDTIEPAPGAPLGDVIEHRELELASLPRTILCRNNSPLIKLALKLLVSGYTAEVAGRDIGQGLIALTKRIASGKNSDRMKSDEFIARLHKWAAREIQRKPKSKPRVQDKMMALEALAAHHSTLGNIRHHLGQLYINPDNRTKRPAEFHLTTIHKAKGHEWPHVLFLDPFLLPAKWAEQEWELQQESNLAYVGITRAQEVLHYCDSENIY